MTPALSKKALSRKALRWVLALAVLALAAAVALWPRGSAGTVPGTQAAQEPLTGSSAPAADLAALRASAALPACPKAGPVADATSATGVLAGVWVPCLGDGATVPLGAALAGRVTLLNVWSHTCEPCRDELPALQEYAARPGAVSVLGVQVDGSPQAGLAMMVALGVRLPSVSDPDGAVRAALSAPPVLPLSYLVSADGSVRMVNPPVVFHSADEVAAAVRQYRESA